MIDALLGEQADSLPLIVRRFYCDSRDIAGEGVFEVWRSRTLPGRALLRLARLPRATSMTLVQLSVHRSGQSGGPRGVERWSRRFGAYPLESVHIAQGRRLIAQVGRVELQFELSVSDERLQFVHKATRVRVAGRRLPVPLWVSPTITGSVGATPEEDGLDVHVCIAAFGTRPLLSYYGQLGETESLDTDARDDEEHEAAS